MRYRERPCGLRSRISLWFRNSETGAWRAACRDNGYGPVGKGGGVRGLLLHAALALDAEMVRYWVLLMRRSENRDKGKATPRRSRARRTRSRQRWLSVAAQAGAALSSARSITVISDRESDIYEHFAQRPANIELIVRANWNRKIELEVRSFCKAVCIC